MLEESIEEDDQCQLPGDHLLMPYIVNHAGNMMTRYRMGADGMTPYQRIKGRRAPEKVVPLGEKVLFMPLKGKSKGMKGRNRLRKLEYRFKYGIWAGVSSKSGEFLILTPEGQKRSRTVRRLPAEKR